MNLLQRTGRWIAMSVLRYSGAMAIAVEKGLRQALGANLSYDQDPGTPDDLQGSRHGWAYALNRQLGGRSSRVAIHLSLRTRGWDGRVQDTPVEDHPFLDLLAQPNEDESGMTFRWRWLDQINSIGRTYLLVQPEVTSLKMLNTMYVSSRPARITLLEPDRVQAIGRPFGRIECFTYMPSNGGVWDLKPAPATYAEREQWKRDPYPFVIRVVLPSGSNSNGGSPIAAMGDEVTVERGLSKLFRSQLVNGIHMQLVFYLLKDIDDPERFKKAALIVKQGIGKAHEPMIVPKKLVEIAPAPVSNSDMQYGNMAEHVRKRVLAALGGNEALVGVTGDINRATLEGLERLVAIGTIDPLNALLAEALNTSLLPLYRGQSETAWYECRFGTSAIMDEVSQADRLSKLVGNKPIVTPDEARQELKLPPMGGEAAALASKPALPDLTKLLAGGEDRAAEPDCGCGKPRKARRRRMQLLDPTHPLTTPEGRAERWKMVDAERRKRERVFARAIAPVFDEWRSATEAALLAPGFGLTRSEPLDVEDWKARLKEAFRTGGEAALMTALVGALKEMGIAEPDEYALAEMRATLNTFADEFAHQVTKTQLKLVRKALDEATVEGLDGEDLALAVGETFPYGVKDKRIQSMSSKEVGSMVGAGAALAAVTYGRKKAHDGVAGLMWLSQRDAVVRDSHAEADGQVIRAGGLFEVGDCEMHFPLDSDTCPLPEEFMNCRCNAVPVVLADGMQYDDDDERSRRATPQRAGS